VSAKTKPVDILLEIDKVWHDLLKLQAALDQLNQHQAVAKLSAIATRLMEFVVERIAEDSHRETADRNILRTLDEAKRLIKQADETLRKSDNQGQKLTVIKKDKKKANPIKVNLGPLDAVILEASLQIIAADKTQWELFRNKPLQFLQRCFPDNQIYVVGFGKLDLAAYLGKGLFRKALIRITERYQAWLKDTALPTNKRTETFFKLVEEKIGKPGILKAMFEVMLGKSLEEVQALGAEDQAPD